MTVPGKAASRACDTHLWESRPSFPVLWGAACLFGIPATRGIPGGKGVGWVWKTSAASLQALRGPDPRTVSACPQDLEEGQVDACQCGVLRTTWRADVEGRLYVGLSSVARPGWWGLTPREGDTRGGRCVGYVTCAGSRAPRGLGGHG